MSYPAERPRRLRRTSALRGLVAETRLHPADLIQPLFVREGIDEPRPIVCMPGQVQHTRDSVRKAAAAAVRAGVGGLLIFGIPAAKDPDGRGAWAPDGITQLAIADVAAEVGDATVVIGDINLDEYTQHGHVGILGPDGDVDNDATLRAYARVAEAQAAAGAHVVAPSGMMDGQVGAIRRALDAAGHERVPILAYAAKYDSAFYGPFRDAVESRLVGTRSTHQQDPANLRESLREVLLDVEEGADMVMVKPAGLYLDVVRRVADAVHVPVVAYQVSGEYAAIEAAAANGWLVRDRAIVESLTAIRRAGAGSVVTYWATEVAERLR
ncbi:porphobilinogen synthase [Nonomuraea muscovyensis]|uniref:Delta-aminolevulinic acid dehydratase n=1 Tax=Nonomuraea muscovyensis TaxID=1124761 RepID=A0A7X0C6Z4_9ACTN|nr:porphobilinogen synthase [Nonomuraea muscovyensis]MBB6349417.1 porphobilinogen synthase [Nonomuraea muscovyensis]